MKNANTYQKEVLEQMIQTGWKVVDEIPRYLAAKKFSGLYDYKLESEKGSLVAYVEPDWVEYYEQ